MLKHCKYCNKDKSIDDFYLNRSSKDGRQVRCKECINSYNKINRDKKKAKKPKKEIILDNKTKKCKACGKVKSISLFYKDSRKDDGLFIKCKVCVDNRIKVPLTPLIINNHKVCSQCKKEKHITKFSKSSKERTGVRSACKDCLNKKSIEYRKRASDKIKAYRDSRRDVHKKYMKEYYEANKETLKKKSAEYNRKFPEKRRERHTKRLRYDNLYKLSLKIGRLIRASLKHKNIRKTKYTEEILGCDKKFFKKHIESQFLNWMNWGNSGKNIGEYDKVWQLDHIIPMCNAQTEDEVYLLNHWSNFQPLCAKRNNKKGCDVYPVTNIELNIQINEQNKIEKLCQK